jgi:glycosyltransferase involved in cell wall biosynthesis
MQERIKLCYILPEYNENNVSHFYHLYEFIEKLSEKMDVFVVAERSKSKEIKLGSGFYIQRFKFLPLRFLENFILIFKLRKRGYKNFYTHYCYISAVNAGIVTRILGGRSYYWNCAMNWLFKPRTLSKLGISLSLKLSHFLITGGETMKDGYAKHYNLRPEKIIVMPNKINLERFSRQETRLPARQAKDKTQETKTILFVHWLSKRKGADVLVPIVKHLIGFEHLTFNFKLIVVGDGPYREQLLGEIKENNLENYIEFIGFVPNKDIVEYYKKADLFILPSMEEGFPMSLLEPMAMGVPYVAFDIGAIRELSPETAQRFLVKSGDVELFAHKIESLLSEPETYKSFQKEELEKVKEYSMDVVMDKFISIFK